MDTEARGCKRLANAIYLLTAGLLLVSKSASTNYTVFVRVVPE